MTKGFSTFLPSTYSGRDNKYRFEFRKCHKDSGFFSSVFICVHLWLILFFVLSFVAGGCKSKPKYVLNPLPLPPSVDSGVIDNQFVQADYGFAFPIPAKWTWVKLSDDQEVDEVARFLDPTKQMLVRVSVQLRNSSQPFSPKQWAQDTEQDLNNHQFTVNKAGNRVERKTKGSERWYVIPYRLTDNKKKAWFNEEWALNKDDMLIGVHAILPQGPADSDKERNY
jgi:hypothetical protein